MISQVVESDFVLGSERFFCCGFSSSSLNNAFLLHGARHSIGTGALVEAQTTASLSHSSFSLRVAPNLVVMFLLIWRMFSNDSSSSTPPTWDQFAIFFSKFIWILNCARFGDKIGTDLTVILMSKVWFCITGNVASSSSVVVILAKKHIWMHSYNSRNSRWLEGKQHHLSYIPCNESAE